MVIWIGLAVSAGQVPVALAKKPPPRAAVVQADDDDSAYTEERRGWWKRFSIRGIQLRAEASKLPGFRCRRSNSDGTGDLDCVQFLDTKQCHGDGSATEAQMMQIGHRVIAVGACMIDFGEQDKTYVRGNYTELEYVRVVGTATDRPRGYRMMYRFKSSDAVSRDSQLGAALIAKYGRPDDSSSNSLRWMISGVARPDMSASCSQGMCMLSLVDDGIRVTEDDLQKEADLAKQKSTAAPPPKF